MLVVQASDLEARLVDYPVPELYSEAPAAWPIIDSKRRSSASVGPESESLAERCHRSQTIVLTRTVVQALRSRESLISATAASGSVRPISSAVIIRSPSWP